MTMELERLQPGSQTHGEDGAARGEEAEVSECHLTTSTPRLSHHSVFQSELPPTHQTQGQALHSGHSHEHQPLLAALAAQPPSYTHQERVAAPNICSELCAGYSPCQRTTPAPRGKVTLSHGSSIHPAACPQQEEGTTACTKGGAKNSSSHGPPAAETQSPLTPLPG